MNFTIAATVKEALSALASGARPVAGGSDLVVSARHGKAPLPDQLIAIDRLRELQQIVVNADGSVRIGAGVTHAELEIHPLIGSTFSALADGSALVGSPATRHVGTLGGNVMNASPAMDTGAPLVVLGATAELQSIDGSGALATRLVPIGELWIGPGRTSAQPNELCVAIHLPARAGRSGSAYLRLEYRRAMEIAVVGAAASVSLAADGSLLAVSVALTAVGPKVFALGNMESLRGRPVDDALLREVASLAEEQATPISDLRAGASYRRHTVGVMARRAVGAAAERANGTTIAIPVNRAQGIGAAR